LDISSTTFRRERGWAPPLPSMMDSPRTLVLAFAAPEFGSDPAALRELANTFPNSIIAGCSTAGEIAGNDVNDASISVAVARFERTELRRAWTTVASAEDSAEAGRQLAEQLCVGANGKLLRAVFVLSDGLKVNGTQLIIGLGARLPAEVSVSGGLAGDGSRFGSTWILDRGTPCPQAICAVGFYGEELRVGQGCEGGWSDFGPERRITRAQGNVLYELDDKPALDLYKNYLGERASGLPGTALLFPLSIRRPGQDGAPLVRTILGIDESCQSLTFAGDMPQGAVARFMRANMDNLIASAGRAAHAAREGAGRPDHELVISVSCVGRRLVLGQRTEEEVESVAEAGAGRSAHVGLYSYGEIARGVCGSASDLHNQTMTVTCLSEA
jgi:hypothetical protein